MIEGFDPFQNRLCRDVRNELSESVIETIYSGAIAPSQAAAEKYLSQGVEPYIRSYIHNRIVRYTTVLSQIQSAKVETTEIYAIAVLLWDQELFFEVHEWLEEKWHKSMGAEKFVLQALIRAAGTYIHFEYGRKTGGEKMAKKAVSGLISHKTSVPEFFNIDLLIAKLSAFDPIPPKLGAASWKKRNLL
ncbi:MAG: DUF309 domain-containing protein [Proteobacteria bacterium]|nr:DUF309 domain-containing protein [Pseudomonadota bacterium]